VQGMDHFDGVPHLPVNSRLESAVRRRQPVKASLVLSFGVRSTETFEPSALSLASLLNLLRRHHGFRSRAASAQALPGF